MATPAIGRRRTASCLRTAVFLFLVTFVWLQLHVATLGGNRQTAGSDSPEGNDSTAAILSMVPQVSGRQCLVSCHPAAPEREEAAGYWRKPRTEELHDY